MTTEDFRGSIGFSPGDARTTEAGRVVRAWLRVRGLARGVARAGATILAAARTRTPDRFTLVQLAGSGAASTGVFWLWGVGVGLLVTGVAALVAGTYLERQS